jgi:hypothetical protein
MEAALEPSERSGRSYFVDIDGAEYEFDHEPVTGGEIMDAAGIPHAVGLVQILEDGTQIAVGVEDAIELKPGRRLKKRPRFKRG